MPLVYTGNSQAPTPPAAQTIPQDGDPEVVSSVNGAFTGLLDNAAFLLLLLGGVYNVKNYGALGDGAADDTAAINAALSAAGSVGGGIVYLPPGQYVITDVLNVPGGSSVFACPGSVLVRQDSVTANVIQIAGGVITSPETTIYGITFISGLGGTGALIIDQGISVRVAVVNCVSQIPGHGLVMTGASSRFRFSNCEFSGAWASPCLPCLAGQFLQVEDCLITFPAASVGKVGVSYADTSVGGIVTGCVFDFGPVTSGLPVGVVMSGGIVVSGNQFIASITEASGQAVRWDSAGLTICLGENDYSQLQLPFGDLPGLPTCAIYSCIALQALDRQDAPGGSVFVRPGVAACQVATTTPGNASPDVYLPTPMYPGQRLTVQIRNTGSGTWNTGGLGPFYHTGGTTMRGPQVTQTPVGDIQTSAWIANDMKSSGTYIWVLEGSTDPAAAGAGITNQSSGLL